jgi:DNA-binding beta-propeller fold protein YncE
MLKGDGSVGIALDPVHNRVYVTNIANNSVSVIDTKTTIPET